MAVSDAQFGKYLMTRSKTDEPDWKQSTDHYALFQASPRDNPDDPAWHVGQVSVLHKEATGYTGYPGVGGSTVDRPAIGADVRTERYDEDWAKSNTHPADHPGQIRGQIPLFRHDGRPASSTLDLALMAKGARHLAPTMIGTAALHTMNEHGRVLEAANDLSPHSERMVQHMQGIGAVPKEHRYSGNNLDWISPSPVPHRGGLEGLHAAVESGDSSVEWPSGDDEEAVPASEVAAGQHLMRSTLKAGRRNQAMQQGHQEALFSGDDYHESDFSLYSRDQTKKRTLYGEEH